MLIKILEILIFLIIVKILLSTFSADQRGLRERLSKSYVSPQLISAVRHRRARMFYLLDASRESFPDDSLNL